jgi:uncharacterized LabA/DUF88 family protein
LHPKAKYFWDSEILDRLLGGDNFFYIPMKAVYFTSFTGSSDELHEAQVFIRLGGFEPQVIEEPSKLEKQREHLAARTGTRKSAKGVDIGLAVRMLEDASRGNFDFCILVTTDIDFLPVIEAVRRMGKHVTVMGYKSGKGVKSKFEYIPDRFIDIGESWMSSAYIPNTSRIMVPTTRRIGPFLVDPAAKKITLRLEKEQLGSLNRINELAGEVATGLETLPTDASIQGNGIAVDAGKADRLKTAALALQAATDAFLAAEKDLT